MTDLVLTNKVALVTGGSRGIGRAIALRLAELGADIIINYARKTGAAEEVVAQIRQKGRRAAAVRANLADPAKILVLQQLTEALFGGCDIIIGNAASGVPRPITQITDKHWDWTMDINARSVLRLAQWAAPYMAERGWGRIVTLSSQGSTRVLPHYGVTGLSKAVIEALTRYLAVELAPKGIVVNAVSPGVVRTDALKHFPIDVQATINETAGRTPSGRIVTPDDVARLVGFLCTDDAAMIVGQTIVLDGGYGLLA